MISDKDFLDFIKNNSLHISDTENLDRLIDNELQKSEAEMDTELIDQCLFIAEEIKKNNKTKKKERIMKKRIILSIAAVFAIILSAGLIITFLSNNYSRMKPIDISDYNKTVSSFYMKFDTDYIIKGYDFPVNSISFKGKVLDIRAYEACWVDDYGDKRSFEVSLIDAVIEEIYYCTDDSLYKKGDKVTLNFSGVVNIEEHTINFTNDMEYIFIGGWIVDEKYYEYTTERNEGDSWKKNPALAESDILMGGKKYEVCAVEDNTVVCYYEYFTPDELEEIALDTSLITPEKVVLPESGKSKIFTAVKEEDFINNLTRLYEEINNK